MISTKTAANALWFTLTCIVIFGCFILKNQVHELEQELSRVNQDIASNVRNIHILKAEWGRLNTPERLRMLAAKHSKLEKLRAEQIINYSALPFENESGKMEIAQNSSKEYKKLVKQEQ